MLLHFCLDTFLTRLGKGSKQLFQVMVFVDVPLAFLQPLIGLFRKYLRMPAAAGPCKSRHGRENSFAQISLTRFVFKALDRSCLRGGGVTNFLKIWFCLLLYVKNWQSNMPPHFQFRHLNAIEPPKLLRQAEFSFSFLFGFYRVKGIFSPNVSERNFVTSQYLQFFIYICP